MPTHSQKQGPQHLEEIKPYCLAHANNHTQNHYYARLPDPSSLIIHRAKNVLTKAQIIELVQYKVSIISGVTIVVVIILRYDTKNTRFVVCIMLICGDLRATVHTLTHTMLNVSLHPMYMCNVTAIPVSVMLLV